MITPIIHNVNVILNELPVDAIKTKDLIEIITFQTRILKINIRRRDFEFWFLVNLRQKLMNELFNRGF